MKELTCRHKHTRWPMKGGSWMRSTKQTEHRINKSTGKYCKMLCYRMHICRQRSKGNKRNQRQVSFSRNAWWKATSVLYISFNTDSSPNNPYYVYMYDQFSCSQYIGAFIMYHSLTLNSPNLTLTSECLLVMEAYFSLQSLFMAARFSLIII